MLLSSVLLLQSLTDSAGIVAALGGLVFLIIGIALIPLIFYLLTLQNTLKAISPANRKMPPGQVWLLLIPLFSIVWQFIVVTKLSQSLEDEFRSRNIPVEPKPTYNIGLAYAVLAAVSVIPLVSIFSGIAALICWIIYWVKVAEYKNKLQNMPVINI